jgi:hypothetical protein
MRFTQRLSDLTYNLRASAEWIDDLADFLFFGKCNHVEIVACAADQPALIDYCNWLRQQGEWTLAFVPADIVAPGEFISLAYRGPALFRWGNWVEVLHMERTGQPFDPDTVMEA